MRACPGGRLKVGGGYIYVDVQGCEGCFSCVEVCEKAAIVRAPSRPVALSGKGSGHVVVGSRAEAKALRKAAEKDKPSPLPTGRPGPAAAFSAGARALVTGRARPKDDTAAQTGAPWGLLDAGTVALVLLMAIALKDAVMDSPAVALMPPVGRVAAGSAVLAVFYAIQLGVLSFLAHRHGVPFVTAFRLRTGFDGRVALVSAALVAVLALATRIASLLWGASAAAAGWPPPDGGSLTGVFGTGPGGLILAVTLAVVVGPLTEELAFRGVIATALDRRFGRRAAVLGSAGLFAFYHVTPWLFVPMFVFGCALGWLALTRRSLWPAIVLHGVYNGVVVAAAFWLAS